MYVRVVSLCGVYVDGVAVFFAWMCVGAQAQGGWCQIEYVRVWDAVLCVVLCVFLCVFERGMCTVGLMVRIHPFQG